MKKLFLPYLTLTVLSVIHFTKMLREENPESVESSDFPLWPNIVLSLMIGVLLLQQIYNESL